MLHIQEQGWGQRYTGTGSHVADVNDPYTYSPRDSSLQQQSNTNHQFANYGAEYPHRADQLYGQHGRIGVYTPEQRAKLLAKFRRKRKTRCWRKIRYNVRKNIANKKVRINGRFAKSEKHVSKISEPKNLVARAQAKIMNAQAHAQALANALTVNA